MLYLISKRKKVVAITFILIAVSALAIDYCDFFKSYDKIIQDGLVRQNEANRLKNAPNVENKMALELTEFLSKKKLDIVYFSDSTMGPHINNENQTMTSDILGEMCNNDVYAISRGAFTANVYYEYTKLISALNYKPKLVIFCLNIRSFSKGWLFRQPNFNEHIAFVRKLRFKPNFFNYIKWRTSNLDLSQFIDQIDNEPNLIGLDEYYSTHSNAIDDLLSTSHPNCLSENDIQVRSSFIENYLGTIDKSHPLLAKFISAKRLLANNGIKFIVYITPINAEDGNILIGQPFNEAVHNNIINLLSVFSDNGITAIDMSSDLNSSYFVDKIHYTTEHLFYEGRKLVANRLCEFIKHDQLIKQ